MLAGSSPLSGETPAGSSRTWDMACSTSSPVSLPLKSARLSLKQRQNSTLGNAGTLSTAGRDLVCAPRPQRGRPSAHRAPEVAHDEQRQPTALASGPPLSQLLARRADPYGGRPRRGMAPHR